MEYNDIFGDVTRQKEAITLFTQLIEIKRRKQTNKQSPPIVGAVEVHFLLVNLVLIVLLLGIKY